MPVVTQSQPANNFGQQQASIERNKRLAQMLMQNAQANMPSANNEVSGRVVPLSPFTALINGLQQGYGTYLDTKATKQQGALEDSRQQALVSALSGNAKPDLSTFAAAGVGADDLLKLATVQATRVNHKQLAPLADGSYGAFNPATGLIEQLDQKSPIYTPQSQRNLVVAKEAPKGVTITNEYGQKYRTTQEQANPQAFGGYGVQPQQRGAPQIDISPNASPEDRAMLEKIQRETQGQFTPRSVQQLPVMGQSLADQEAIKAQADIEKARQVEGIKTQEELNREGGKIAAKSAATAAIDLPKVQASAEYAKGLIDSIVSHPGLPGVVGLPNLPGMLSLPGTKEADFKARLDQINGQNFLQAFEALKGGGQITEVEGEKATDAIARLNTSQTEEEFKRSAMELKGIIDGATQRAAQKAQGQGIQNATLPQQQSHDDLVKKYLGGQ